MVRSQIRFLFLEFVLKVWVSEHHGEGEKGGRREKISFKNSHIVFEKIINLSDLAYLGTMVCKLTPCGLVCLDVIQTHSHSLSAGSLLEHVATRSSQVIGSMFNLSLSCTEQYMYTNR